MHYVHASTTPPLAQGACHTPLPSGVHRQGLPVLACSLHPRDPNCVRNMARTIQSLPVLNVIVDVYRSVFASALGGDVAISAVQEQLYNFVRDLVCTDSWSQTLQAAVRQRIHLFHSWAKLHANVVKALKDKRGDSVPFCLHDRSVDIQALCRLGKGVNVADIDELVASIKDAITMVDHWVAHLPDHAELCQN